MKFNKKLYILLHKLISQIRKALLKLSIKKLSGEKIVANLDRNEIIQSYNEAATRCQYAYRLNIIFMTWFDNASSDFPAWSAEKKYTRDFNQDLYLLLTRALVSELAAIFDKVDRRQKQYNVGSLISQTRNFLTRPENEKLFIFEKEFSLVDFGGFEHITSSCAPYDDWEIFNLLEKEYNSFKSKHAAELEKLRILRNKMMSHLDLDHAGCEFLERFYWSPRSGVVALLA